MNVEFKPQFPVPEITEAIIISGKVYGDIKSLNPEVCGADCRFHACIELAGVGGSGLIQGFGPSREAAIADAIEKGRRRSELMLIKIAELENLLLSRGISE